MSQAMNKFLVLVCLMQYLGYTYNTKKIYLLFIWKLRNSQWVSQDGLQIMEGTRLFLSFLWCKVDSALYPQGKYIHGYNFIDIQRRKGRKMSRLPRAILLYSHDGVLRNQSRLSLNQGFFRSKENKSIHFGYWKARERRESHETPSSQDIHLIPKKAGKPSVYSQSLNQSLSLYSLLLCRPQPLLPSLLLSKSAPFSASPLFLLP